MTNEESNRLRAENDRMRTGRGPNTYTGRAGRYAENALVEADLAIRRAHATRRAVRLTMSAAQNARRNGDLVATDLYTAIASAHQAIAGEHDRVAQLERDVAEHYAREAGR